MPSENVSKTENIMIKAMASLERDYKRLRTGRATPALIEHLSVNYYGSETPISQVASISAPEPRMLVLKPFDTSIMTDLEKAIIKSDLGLNPQNDGKIMRLAIPPLTEETRKKLVTDTKKILEHAKISVRNARRDGNKDIDQECKDKKISEDQRDAFKEEIQELTKNYETKLDGLQKAKEKELLTV
ncbi:MAG: ribosome recycling factor [Planctomycetes bacterium]|nr:ribosome recycling factor [Planctomycetota bacterium]